MSQVPWPSQKSLLGQCSIPINPDLGNIARPVPLTREPSAFRIRESRNDTNALPPSRGRSRSRFKGKMVHEIIHRLTDPDAGAYPLGIAPKNIYMEMERISPCPPGSRNQLQVELYRGVKLGRYVRLSPAVYSTPEHSARRRQLLWEMRRAGSSGGVPPADTGGNDDGFEENSATPSPVLCRSRMPTDDRARFTAVSKGDRDYNQPAVEGLHSPDPMPMNSERPRKHHQYPVPVREAGPVKLDSFNLPSLRGDPVLIAAAAQDVKSWTVDNVAKFIEDLGFPEEVSSFRKESIDGAALLLLKRSHFVNCLQLKLGPALLIFRRVVTLKEMLGIVQN